MLVLSGTMDLWSQVQWCENLLNAIQLQGQSDEETEEDNPAPQLPNPLPPDPQLQLQQNMTIITSTT